MPSTATKPEKIRIGPETATRIIKIKRLRRALRWSDAIDVLLDGWDMLTDKQKEQALNGK
jgi:hypothetical protein